MKIGSIDPSQACPVCGKRNCVAQSILGRSVRYKCSDCSFPFANSIRQASIKLSWRDKKK